MTTDPPPSPPSRALLVLPRLWVQNANAVSSPLTWGFPAITAFAGLMTALERRLGREAGIAFYRFGVVCHGFEPQVTRGGYTRSFHLTRNPVLSDGSTAAIVEEGRVHLSVTLLFDVELEPHVLGPDERKQLAARIGDLVAGMRVAGGSVMPPPGLGTLSRAPRPSLQLLSGTEDDMREEFRKRSRRWLPGFVVVSRDDLLQARLVELREQQPNATALDAWLDLSRLNHRAVQLQKEGSPTGSDRVEPIEWQTDRRPGWIVPMPVGFATLSGPHPAGTVVGTRDPTVPLCFVESVYSVGQWISPHRLSCVDDVMWQPDYDAAAGLYRCTNAYRPPAAFS